MILGQKRKIALFWALIAVSVFSALQSCVFAQQTDGLRAGFHQPPAQARTHCYWWWLNGNTTADTITRDLEGMKAKGIGGAILVDAGGSGQQGNEEVAMGPAIGSPQWIALFVHALKEAQRLGLEISLNVTSRWDVGIIGGATVTPADTIKLLTWSRTTVEGGGARKLQLAAPREENGFYRPIAVLAYPLRHGAALPGEPASGRSAIKDLRFKDASRETGFSMTPSSRVLRDDASAAGEQDADVADVVDLTSRVGDDGRLEWNFPAGTWEVLRIGYTDTAKYLMDESGMRKGLPLDALSATAFDDYWRDAVTPLLNAAKPYIGTSLRYLVTDSWEAGGANWTDNFREEFKRRRGYDPLPYLPVVTGRIVGSRAISNRFLFDLRRTVADLIAENYYDRFADHAAKWGLGTHPEAGGPHGAPIDALENFRKASLVQTEFWVVSGTHRVTEDERFFVKEASSAAHIYGKTLVAAEGPTSMNPASWSESLGRDVQPTFDHALTEGLNRLYWHEFTSSPASAGLPGQEYFAGTHLNPNVTWWSQAAPLLLAFNRAQFLLQQGLPVSDLLYFYGDQVPAFVRPKSDDPAHVLPGYDYDVTDEDALLHRMQFQGSNLHTPEGIHYRALALPASGRISLPALQWVARFVGQGGVVIGTKPSGPLGMISEQQQAQYVAIANSVWGGCKEGAAKAGYGKGVVYCTADAHRALSSAGIAADFSYRSKEAGTENAGRPLFDYVHRRTADAEIYFVRNTLPRAVQATLSFRVSGRAPELWVTDDGTTAPAPVYRFTSEGRTEIPLEFPAQGSVFVIFEHPAARHLATLQKDGAEVFPSIRQGTGVFSDSDRAFVVTEPGTYTATDSNGQKHAVTIPPDDLKAPVAGSWTLSFAPGWGAPPQVPLPGFRSWTDFSDPGIRFFSGTAVYRSVIHLPADYRSHQRELWLEMGDVREIATVKINGRRADTTWRQPFAARIDELVHSGDNSVEIEVTNLWPNRLIGDLQPSAHEKFTNTNIRAYTKDSPLLPSGILEPVRLSTGSVVAWP